MNYSRNQKIQYFLNEKSCESRKSRKSRQLQHSLGPGYELPENKGMKYIFDATMIASATLTKDRMEWIGKDILDLRELNGSPSCVFSFWVGFPLPVQEHILHLCEKTTSVQTIAVFKDSKWRHADQGMTSFMLYSAVLFLKLDLQDFKLPKRALFAVIDCLRDASSRTKHDGFGWYLKKSIQTDMHGSGQRHESWVFQRQLAPTN